MFELALIDTKQQKIKLSYTALHVIVEYDSYISEGYKFSELACILILFIVQSISS